MENDTTKSQDNEERKGSKKKDDVECSIYLCATEKKYIYIYMACGQWMLKTHDRRPK